MSEGGFGPMNGKGEWCHIEKGLESHAKQFELDSLDHIVSH